MSNLSAAATTWNCPNYVGELFLVGASQTPFLNMMGGLNGGKQYAAFEFPTGQPWALNAASQAAVSETASITAPTATSYVRTHSTNSVQIVHKAVTVTYAKQSTTQVITADSTTGKVMQGVNPATDELDFQIMANLRQAALDIEYSFIQGTYVQATEAADVSKTRGILEAVDSNNTIAATGTPQLDKALFNSLLREMAGNGAIFQNPVVLVNAYQKQLLSEIFGYAPTDRNVGGVNIGLIETDFAQLGVVWAPQMPAGELAIVEMSVVAPVFCPVPGKGLLFYEELSRTGAALRGQIYAQVGLDHGPGIYHGKITGLATS